MIFYKFKFKSIVFILLCQFIGQSPSSTGTTGSITHINDELSLALGTSVSAITISMGGTQTAGNILVAKVSVNSSLITVSSITTGGGLVTGVWTKQVSFASTTSGLDAEIWTAAITTGSSTSTITVNFSSIAFSAAAGAAEFSNLSQIADGTSSANGSSPGNLITTNANDLIVDVASENAAASPTVPGAPWLQLGSVGNTTAIGSNVGQSAAYQIVSSTGIFNPIFTGATQVIQIALKASSTSTGPSGPPSNFEPDFSHGESVTMK